MAVDSLAYKLEDQRLMSAARNYFAWQVRMVKPYLGRRVLEVGCGTGNLTGYLLDRELVISIDIEPECVAALRRRLPGAPNLVTSVTAPGEPEFASLRRHRPDSCVCTNVLEHIEDDLYALREMARPLPPGGPIVLLVPAFAALYGPIDRNLGHYRRYTKGSVRSLARAAGLKVGTLRYMNVPGFFAWWWNARVAGRQSHSERQIALFDRVVVPVISRMERLIPPPFGQSLLAVLTVP
jgi:SAM-dependent methyltransferase